jgi:hypothetical protein
MYTNPPPPQTRSKLAPKRPTGSNSWMDGNRSIKINLQPGEQKSSHAAESPPLQQARTQPLPAADEILTYKSDEKRTVTMDASVAAYFADLFRNIKKGL